MRWTSRRRAASGCPGRWSRRCLPDRLHTDVTALPVRMAELVDPKLEAEIGIRLDADGMRLAPCVEIADCRFAGWALPPGGAPADFGLQGSMVFGPVVEPVAEVHVEVRHDGETVGAGGGTWAEAAARLSLLPAALAPEPSWRPARSRPCSRPRAAAGSSTSGPPGRSCWTWQGGAEELGP